MSRFKGYPNSTTSACFTLPSLPGINRIYHNEMNANGRLFKTQCSCWRSVHTCSIELIKPLELFVIFFLGVVSKSKVRYYVLPLLRHVWWVSTGQTGSVWCKVHGMECHRISEDRIVYSWMKFIWRHHSYTMKERKGGGNGLFLILVWNIIAMGTY